MTVSLLSAKENKLVSLALVSHWGCNSPTKQSGRDDLLRCGLWFPGRSLKTESSLTHSPWADDPGRGGRGPVSGTCPRGVKYSSGESRCQEESEFYSLWSDWTGAAEAGGAVLRRVNRGSLGVSPPPPSR